MASSRPSLGWRLLASISAITAGIAARKVLVALVRRTTGKEAPVNPEAPGTSWQEAIGWAVASGAAMGMARMLATRKAVTVYEKSTGHLPRGMEAVS